MTDRDNSYVPLGDDLLAQGDVERMILRDLDALEDATKAYRGVCRDVARAESVYENGRARAFLEAEGPIQQRTAISKDVMSQAFKRWKMAEGVERHHKQHLWTIRNRLEALRSLNANMRDQV